MDHQIHQIPRPPARVKVIWWLEKLSSQSVPNFRIQIVDDKQIPKKKVIENAFLWPEVWFPAKNIVGDWSWNMDPKKGDEPDQKQHHHLLSVFEILLLGSKHFRESIFHIPRTHQQTKVLAGLTCQRLNPRGSFRFHRRLGDLLDENLEGRRFTKCWANSRKDIKMISGNFETHPIDVASSHKTYLLENTSYEQGTLCFYSSICAQRRMVEAFEFLSWFFVERWKTTYEEK